MNFIQQQSTCESKLVNELIELESSTTLWLEYLKGTPLQIKVIGQSEEKTFGSTLVKREAKLFFESDKIPALYCVSYLNKENLTQAEYQCIKEEDTPIGRMLIRLNDIEVLKKKNINITVETNSEISKRLNVTSAVLYKKEYEYWVADRKIGRIIEIFNEESLNRM